MFETSGSWPHQQKSRWESFALKNCMIAPVEHRQHEFLPAVNPYRVSTDSGLNGFRFSGLPERGLVLQSNGLVGKSLPHRQTSLLAPNEYLQGQTSLCPAKVDAQASPPSQHKKFVIFDRSDNETRQIFSSLCPWVPNISTALTCCPRWNEQAAPVMPSGAYQFFGGQPNLMGEACIKTPILYNEESGENETVDDEGSEIREDTEEINALLYSDDDDGTDVNCDVEGEDDEEVSTGHSPLAKWEEEDYDEVASYDRSSKRQKALDGGCNEVPLLCTTTLGKRNALHENMHGGDLICALDEELGPTIGKKRPRKDKIRHTLDVLESIIPGVESKEPLVILDAAISYLKSLKSNAESISMEDPDTSTCYGPSP